MDDKSRGWLFRKRTILGAALVAGVIVGQYLPNFWNGFGGGSVTGVGLGDPKNGTPTESPNDTTDAGKPVDDEIKLPANVPPVIKVVIDDRSYFIRSTEGDRRVEIAEVIALAKAAAGDADGIRVRVYRKGTSRPSAENALQDAFNDAKIGDNAVFWVPTTSE